MKNKLPLYFFALLSVLVLFNSCKKDYPNIQTVDEEKIQEYIKKNNYTMTKDPSGFYYQVLSTGAGGTIANSDSVFFDFNYKSLTGVSYYESPTYFNIGEYLGYLAKPYTVTLGAVTQSYPGTVFRTAISNVQRGGKVRVIIPSYLAYGKNGADKVPSNEILVSEITVFSQSKQWELDDARIQTFLTANNLTATKEASRIYRIITQPGTGTDVADISSTVEIKYKGRLLSGPIFDQTADGATSENGVNNFVRGFQKALIGYTAGTKMRVFIPSDLAYGPAAQAVIPQNSVLDFDIEIVKVTN